MFPKNGSPERLFTCKTLFNRTLLRARAWCKASVADQLVSSINNGCKPRKMSFGENVLGRGRASPYCACCLHGGHNGCFQTAYLLVLERSRVGNVHKIYEYSPTDVSQLAGV